MSNDDMSNQQEKTIDEKEKAPGKECDADKEPVQSGSLAEDETLLLQTLMNEKLELEDRVLRLAAEMENLRRRTTREIQDARCYGISAFARDMLNVSDDLQRGLGIVGEDVRKSADSAIRALIEGLELTERAMLSAFERHGVRKVIPEGEKFDPNFHEAMFEVSDPTRPPNTVIEVVQAGYCIGDRVLRPARVGVSCCAAPDAAKDPVQTDV